MTVIVLGIVNAILTAAQLATELNVGAAYVPRVAVLGGSFANHKAVPVKRTVVLQSIRHDRVAVIETVICKIVEDVPLHLAGSVLTARLVDGTVPAPPVGVEPDAVAGQLVAGAVVQRNVVSDGCALATVGVPAVD